MAYTFAEGEDGNYLIVEGHGHVYNIAEAFMAEDGTIYVRIKCSCGVYYVATSEEGGTGTAEKAEADIFAIPSEGVNYEVKENEDGTISYVFTASSDTFTLTNVDESDESAGGDVTLTYSEITLTMTPTIKIVISGGGDEESPTVYYLDEDSMNALEAIIASAGNNEGVTVTLLGDVDVGELVIADENVTIDLGGNELSGKITLGSSKEEPSNASASLEITDSSAGEAGLGEGSACNLEIEIGSGCEFTVSGGTYGEGVQITDENEGKENATIKDYVKSDEEDEPSYAVVERDGGSFTVVSEDTAESFSAVKIEIDGDTDIYFGSIEAALNYIKNGSVSGATVVLLNDCECVEELQISSSVTIDLNGKTLTADIVIEGDAVLTIEDSSATGGSVSGTGAVYGEIYVDGGTLEVCSGSYATDVGAYVKSEGGADNVLYAAEDADGNILYTVVAKNSVSSTAEASITYTTADGAEITVYYDSVEDAVRSLKDGDTLTILTDVGSAESPKKLTISGVENVIIDLGGHDIYADITVEGGSEVTIKDFGDDDGTCGTLHGSFSGDGDITVESGSFTEDVAIYLEDGVLLAASKDGEIIYTVTTQNDVDTAIESGDIQASITYKTSDGDEVTVYYESAMDAISSLTGGDKMTLLTDIGSEEEGCSLEFTYSDVSGNSIDVTLDLNGCAVYGDIEAGTGVNLVIVDGSASGSEGFVTGDIGASGNGDVSIEGGIYESDVSKYVGDGFAVLVKTSFDENGEMSYVYEVTMETVAEEEAVASVTYTYTDEYGERREVTVWFDDIQSALDFASEISSGEDAAEDVTLTLEKDCVTARESGEGSTYEIKSGTFTVDMGSSTTDINLEISGDARVEVIGEGEIEGDITVKDAAFLEISGDVSFTGEISEDTSGEGAGISISGGTYATNVSQWTEDGFDVIYSDGAYYVKESGGVTDEAAASVTITVDGVETTTYYESFEDALKALYEAMENDTEGEGSYKLTLWDDVDVKSDISESSELLSDDGALILEGNFTFDLNGHTFTGDAVVSGSSDDKEEGSEVEILIDGGVWAGDLTVEAEAKAEVDLGGGEFVGDIIVGDSENGAALSVTDSSEGFDAGYAGSGSMSGSIINNGSGENEISVSGGSYSGDVREYVNDENYAVVMGEGGSSIVVPAGRESEYSEAYVTVGEDKKVYYESIDDAIKAAAESGGTVTLTSDASMSGEVEISSSVTIDLAGFDLEINVVIDSSSDGSLKIEDTSEGDAGELSGSIRVIGEGGEGYENILTMEGGVAPGGDLEIDLSEFGEEGEFIFAETEGESDDTTYGIASLDKHAHSYNVAVWTLNEDGTVTVSFMCACGKYLADKNGNIITYTATVIVIDGEDGVYEFEASVSIDEENADGVPAGEYSKSWTVEAVAVVEADGKTYYMTDLEDAVELAEKLGGTVTLYEDYDGDIEISGDVEINLNGHDINGTVTVDAGAYLIISGEGFVSGLEAKDFANVKLRGGTYDEDEESIETYVDNYGGYAVFVGVDGYVSVMREDMAATKAEAAVTDNDGNTVYYESLDEAVKALEDGFTLTLWDNIDEGEIVLIDGIGGVEIDANGFSIEGELVISNSDGVTINMDGGLVAETGSVTFIGSDDATLNMGGEAFSGGNIEGQVKFEDSDNSSVNMDGGAVTGTGSVEFTNSKNSSFNAEGGSVSGSVTFDDSNGSSVNMGGGNVEKTGEVVFVGSGDSSFNAGSGNIEGTVSFTGSENASLTMGCDGEDGGDVDGRVSFEECDGATVDMDGGNVGETGEVEFKGSDDSSFNAGSGDIDGTVSFTNSENASLTMGCDGEDGGKIEGCVSFDGCDGATLDMDGGSLEGEVSFSNLDGSEFNLSGGTVEESGEVNFNQSEDSAINLGGGTFSGIVTAEDGSFVEITGSGDATEGTFAIDGGSELSIHGGTYSNDTLEKYYEESEGYVVVGNGDDTSTVMTTEEFIENAAVSVTYVTDDGEVVEEHFAAVEDALEAVKDLGKTDIVVKLEGDYSGDIEFDSTGNVTFDLAGHTVTGNISIKGGGTLTIIDSEGGAFVNGDVSSEDGSGGISIEGGSYSEDVSGFVESDGGKTYVTVIGHGEDGNAVYSVMTEEEAAANSYVYIETYDEVTGETTRQYYETLEDAIANLDGGTITLTGDLDVSDRKIEITTEVLIDTNGYNLGADFVIIVGDDGNEEISGSLSIEDTSDAGTGSFTGKVTVKGSGSGETEDYSDAFVLDGGLSASGLEVDLSGLGEDGSYHFEMTADGNYGIVSGGSHSFTIPVWSVTEDGSITLELKCECGEYLEDTEGEKVVFVLTNATVEETEEGLHVTGTIEATYTYVNVNGVLVEVTNSYDCDMYLEGIAATVEAEGGELYVFDDVQDAVDFAAGCGGYVTLYEDAEDISVDVKTREVVHEDKVPETDEDGNYVYDEEGNLIYEVTPQTDENGDYVYDEDGNLVYTDVTVTWVETVYTDVIIDLNGRNIGISVQADKGNSVTLTDSANVRGWADVGLSVDGVVIFDDVNIRMSENVVEGDTDVSGEIWIRGETTIDLSDMTIFNVTEIEGNLTLTGETGSSMKLGSDIDLSGGSITIEGSTGIDLGGCDLMTDITVSEGASFDFNLNGATFTGDIDLGSGSSVTIRDSSVNGTGGIGGVLTAEGDCDITIFDGVYDPYDSSFDITLSDSQILQSATDLAGDTYYETADAAEHARSGRHGYDTLAGAEFDAASGALTLTFECLCGKKSVRVIYLTENDYVTAVGEDGVVTVRYDVAGSMEASNGSVYAYSASGELTLPAFTEGESGNGYLYAVVTLPGCEETGLDTYTYGDGKGVVVRVVTPVSHVVGEAQTIDGVTYYYCSRCGKYVTDAHSDAQYNDPRELVSDVGYQNSYNEKKDEALAELEDKKDEIIAGIDEDTPGYDDIIKIVEKVFDELYDEISGMDYEAQTESGTGRDLYVAALEEALEEALSGAMVEVEKTAREEVSRNVLQDTYNQLYDSGKYSDEALDELKGELDAAMADLEVITVTSEDDIAEIYDAYLERVLAALYAIRITRAETTGDSDHQGYVESSDGLSSGVEVVIVELDLEDYTFSSDADLLYKGSEELTESEVSALVEGKGIVAVFDISLVDSESGTEIYVFSGTYFVRVELPQYLLGYDGLQVVYVGDDGRVEVYDTNVNDGYLEFTTTHFSEYIILGVGGVMSEKDTDLMGAIIALAVVSGVLLILMIVLLVIFLKRKNGGKKIGCVASMALLTALLSVTPSGGVAIVVVLGVVALALLVADIIFIVEIVKGPALITSALEEGTVMGDEIVALSEDSENPDGSEGDEKTL
ncbi:MAG: hypothetical protein LUD29_02125 [Clostridia bacterium]|nr:hypothetical protein [Clostridia bacterium]